MPPADGVLLDLFSAIAGRDRPTFERALARTPDVARMRLEKGASRADPKPYFLTPIRHYVYAGDTALHVAAAAYAPGAAAALLALGAPVDARNRRGAEPLHYAADGRPGDPSWAPDRQHDLIELLIRSGADPNSVDRNGVAPLHRAVRTRTAAAVGALLDLGADPRRQNAGGSTPLHLAVQNTGRSGSGSADAKEQQTAIIGLLLRHGARAGDLDARGRTVAESATSQWVRDLLVN